jgi:hypothetical protein
MERDPDAIPVVYLDTSVYGRPFDDPAVGTNRREIRAVRALVDAIQEGDAQLVSSFAVQDVCARANADVQALEQAMREFAQTVVPATPEVEALAARLTVEAGLKPGDSLHVACAILAGAGDFLSCTPRRISKQAAVEAVLGHAFPMMTPSAFVRDVLV